MPQRAQLSASSVDAAHVARGTAALLVAVAHAWQIFMLPLSGNGAVFQFLSALATWSVATFFVLSGFLIAFSVRRHTSGQFDFRGYITARILRVFPSLYAAVLLTIGVFLIIKGFGLHGSETYQLPDDPFPATRERASLEWANLPYVLTLTYNLVPGWGGPLLLNGPLWALSYEFAIYVIAGLTSAALINRSWLAAAASLSLIIGTILIDNRLLMIFGTVWAIGFSAGLLWDHLRTARRVWLAVVSLCLVALAFPLARGELIPLLVNPYNSTQGHFVYLVMGTLLTVAIVAFVSTWQTSIERSPAWFRWLQRTSHFSYTLYLIHFPLMMLAVSLLRPSIARYGFSGHLVAAAVTFGIILAVSAPLARVAEDRTLLRKLVSRRQ